MKGELSRRAALRALAGLPALMAAGAAAGTREEFALAIARDPRLIAFATARAESLAAPLETVSGRLPAGLAGVLWRNGPAEHERFGRRYSHWFDGDGMVQAYRFADGSATHRARILDTPKRRRETRAGARILPAFGTPGSEMLLGPDDMNVANTAMLAHAGRLMALWEGGSALGVDPETLAAGEFVAWRPDLAGLPFSAHPKIEPDGTLWNIGFVTRPRPALLLYRVDRGGRKVAANLLDAGPMGMAHDFVVTARHLVVLLTPFVVEPDRLSSDHTAFLDSHAWRPGLGTRVVVIDKNTLEPVRRHRLPPGFHFHHGNGWEEPDGTIRLDLCQAPGPGFVTGDLRAVMRGALGFPSPQPRYRGVVLRPGGGAGIEDAAPGVAEFPRIDPRLTGRRHRKVFALTGSGAEDGWPLRSVAPPRPGTGRDRRLGLPAASDPRGARLRGARPRRGRGLADRPLYRREAAGRRAQRVRGRPHRRRPAVAGHPPLPAAARAARDVRSCLTRAGGPHRADRKARLQKKPIHGIIAVASGQAA